MKIKQNLALTLLLAFLLQGINSFAQSKMDSLLENKIPSYAFVDTIISKMDPACELIDGSIIKPKSMTNKESLEKGYEFIRFELSPCNNKLNPHKLKERISFKKLSQDTLTLEIATIATCCYDMLGEIEIKENDTLNLKFEACGNSCACVCCFSMRYQIKSSKNLVGLNFQLNGEPIEEYPHTYPKTKSIRETLGNGTTVLKFFEDDKLKFEKMWSNEKNMTTFKEFKNGLLTHESIEIIYPNGLSLKIIKKFNEKGLLSESIYDDENKLHIERKFDCGALIEETKEELKQ
jgi:hypothetical protein